MLTGRPGLRPSGGVLAPAAQRVRAAPPPGAAARRSRERRPRRRSRISHPRLPSFRLSVPEQGDGDAPVLAQAALDLARGPPAGEQGLPGVEVARPVEVAARHVGVLLQADDAEDVVAVGDLPRVDVRARNARGCSRSRGCCGRCAPTCGAGGRRSPGRPGRGPPRRSARSPRRRSTYSLHVDQQQVRGEVRGRGSPS